MANKLGRRNNVDLRRIGVTPKAEVYDLAGELFALGLGTVMIAKLLGYSRDYITRVRRDLKTGKRRDVEHVLINLLPPDLKSRVFSIRMRSEQLYASKGRSLRDGRAGALEEVDEDEGVCVNGLSGRETCALKKRKAA